MIKKKGDLVGNLGTAIKAAVFHISEGPLWERIVLY